MATTGSGTQADPFTEIECDAQDLSVLHENEYFALNCLFNVTRYHDNWGSGWDSEEVTYVSPNRGLTIRDGGLQGRITGTGDISITTIFEDDGGSYDRTDFVIHVVVLSYTVSLTAGTGGTVTGSGTYDYGTSVTITAIPDTGYAFVSWSDSNTDATRTITVTSNIILTASFIQNTADYRKLTLGDAKIQVDSTIRDGEGNRIKTVYAKKSEYPIITVSDATPTASDGKDGDVWIQY